MSRTTDANSEELFASPIPDAADSDLLQEAARTLLNILDELDIDVEYLAFFGSQVTGTAESDSDLDVLIVSSEFEDESYHKRTVDISLEWPVLELPSLDTKPLTPDEFAIKRDKEDNDVINDAVSDGLLINLS